MKVTQNAIENSPGHPQHLNFSSNQVSTEYCLSNF